MSNYFILELDTTGPIIDIIAPTYTVNNTDNYTEIIINSNERLMEEQSIYIVDSTGAEHHYIFEYKGNQLYGLVNFSNIAIGIATIYARLKDEVGNLSATVTKTIDVLRSAKINIFINEAKRTINTISSVRSIHRNSQVRDISINEINRQVTLSDRSRKVEVTVE